MSAFCRLNVDGKLTAAAVQARICRCDVRFPSEISAGAKTLMLNVCLLLEPCLFGLRIVVGKADPCIVAAVPSSRSDELAPRAG